MFKRIQVVLTVFVVVFAFSAGAMIISKEDFIVDFIQVGQGDCCMIKTPGGRRVLIDGGISGNTADKTPIVKYCAINGINKIDVAFVSHYHDDHAGGMVKLFEQVPCELLLLPEPVQDEDIECLNKLLQGCKDARAYFFQQDEWVTLGDNLIIKALYFNPQENDANESTMVLKAACYDTRLLFTGDVGFETENSIMATLSEEVISCDIIKVAHHGSKYSSSSQFLEAASPKEAIICVGSNPFGHPSQEAMERITNAGAKIYRTDIDGTIRIRVSESGYTF